MKQIVFAVVAVLGIGSASADEAWHHPLDVETIQYRLVAERHLRAIRVYVELIDRTGADIAIYTGNPMYFAADGTDATAKEPAAPAVVTIGPSLTSWIASDGKVHAHLPDEPKLFSTIQQAKQVKTVSLRLQLQPLHPLQEEVWAKDVLATNVVDVGAFAPLPDPV